MIGPRLPDKAEFAPGAPMHRRAVPTLRAGFTLFEMMLVLAVMVAMAAIAWPSLTRIYAYHQLRQSAEMVQVRMVAARVHALESGQAYQFCFEPDGRRYIVVPTEITAGAASNGSTQQTSQPAMHCLAGELESHVHFDSAGWQGGPTIPNAFLAGLPDPSLYSDVHWAGPVLFNPDGSSSPGQVVVTDTKQHSLRIVVRPLTGGVTIAAGE